MKDSEIVDLFFKRQELAVDIVADKYGNAMRAVSYNLLRNESDAEECVNDSLLAIWYAIPPDRPDLLYPYVCRIARNISLNRIKYNNAAKRDRRGSVSLDEIADVLPDGKTVDDELDDKILTDCLNNWLDTQDEHRRYIFVRRYWYVDSAEDIANALGISTSAVYQRLNRMKKSLYKFLKERGITV